MQKQDEMLRRYELLCDQIPNEEHLSEMQKMRGIYYRTKSIKSGTLLEVEAYPLLPKDIRRAVKRLEVTREAIRLHNQRVAEKRCVRLVECNFTEADWFFTATLEARSGLTIDKMHKLIRRFISRVNYERKKRGMANARYIYVVEGYEEGSKQTMLHVHMIIDGGLTREELKTIWGQGRTKCEELDPKGYNGLIKLAKYMMKDPKGRKRWVASKGLKQPIVSIADRKIKQSAANRIATSPAEAAAALEKLYPGYEHIETEVKTNPYIPGCYIYAVLRKKEEPAKKDKRGAKKHEQGNTDRERGGQSGNRPDGERSGICEVPDGGEQELQKRGRKQRN